jgi:carboxymethylenebutenolidase
MCDELTLADEVASASAKGISRRNFSAMAAMSAAAVLGRAEAALAAAPALSESAVAITTPDGTCDALFIHPAKGKHRR